MREKQHKDQKNEGEGDRTAARQYNEAQRRFVKSGKVEEKAKEAERAIAGREGDRLREAELVGKRHTHEEDPEVQRRARAPTPTPTLPRKRGREGPAIAGGWGALSVSASTR